MIDDLRIVQLFTQMGSFGLLAYLAIYGLPRLIDAARDELARQRKESNKERVRLTLRAEYLERSLSKQLAALRVLLCAIAHRLHVQVDDEDKSDSGEVPTPPTLPGGTK